jgi:hypothetical protein
MVRKAEKAGCDATYSGAGHWKIKTPSGQTVVCSSTPRDTKRSIKNTVARLRRAGVQI